MKQIIATFCFFIELSFSYYSKCHSGFWFYILKDTRLIKVKEKVYTILRRVDTNRLIMLINPALISDL